jgi:hypothetical protein
MNLPKIPPAHRIILILAPIITVIAVGLFGRIVFGSLTDLFDFQLYYDAVENILHGQMPWAYGVEFYYPPLAFVPMLIAYAISLAGGGFLVFAVAMWALMLICNIITTFCVYYIGLKIYSEKTAFIAAILNATALSVAYYTLCRFDPFPTCLAMVAVLATLYGEKATGYLASVLGLFVKIWPVVVFPFLWLYNARNTSLMEEGKARASAFLIGGGLLFGLMILAGYDKFLGYIDRVYCNTVPYTVDQYLQVLGIAIPFGITATLFRILMVVVIAAALYLMYRQPENVALMLKLILAVIIVITAFSQYRSPQYIVWFTPFAALLIADDIRGILVFIAVQVLAYIEYPLGYGVLYVNDSYVSGWGLVFFTVFFLMIGLLLWRALKMERPDIPGGEGAVRIGKASKKSHNRR